MGSINTQNTQGGLKQLRGDDDTSQDKLRLLKTVVTAKTPPKAFVSYMARMSLGTLRRDDRRELLTLGTKLWHDNLRNLVDCANRCDALPPQERGASLLRAATLPGCRAKATSREALRNGGGHPSSQLQRQVLDMLDTGLLGFSDVSQDVLSTTFRGYTLAMVASFQYPSLVEPLAALAPSLAFPAAPEAAGTKEQMRAVAKVAWQLKSDKREQALAAASPAMLDALLAHVVDTHEERPFWSTPIAGRSSQRIFEEQRQWLCDLMDPCLQARFLQSGVSMDSFRDTVWALASRAGASNAGGKRLVAAAGENILTQLAWESVPHNPEAAQRLRAWGMPSTVLERLPQRRLGVPTDVLMLVISYLDVTSLFNVRAVSKAFAGAVPSRALYRRHLREFLYEPRIPSEWSTTEAAFQALRREGRLIRAQSSWTYSTSSEQILSERGFALRELSFGSDTRAFLPTAHPNRILTREWNDFHEEGEEFLGTPWHLRHVTTIEETKVMTRGVVEGRPADLPAFSHAALSRDGKFVIGARDSLVYIVSTCTPTRQTQTLSLDGAVLHVGASDEGLAFAVTEHGVFAGPLAAKTPSMQLVSDSPTTIVAAVGEKNLVTIQWRRPDGTHAWSTMNFSGNTVAKIDLQGVSPMPMEVIGHVSGSACSTLLAWRMGESPQAVYFDLRKSPAVAKEVPAEFSLDRGLDQVRISSNGRLLAQKADRRFVLWDIQDERTHFLAAPDARKYYNIAVSPDGKNVAAAGDSEFQNLNRIDFWALSDDLRQVEPPSNWRTLHSKKVKAMTFDPFGKRLMVLERNFLGTNVRFNSTRLEDSSATTGYLDLRDEGKKLQFSYDARRVYVVSPSFTVMRAYEITC